MKLTLRPLVDKISGGVIAYLQAMLEKMKV